ncbi:MAG TPA: SCO1664 family protein [Pseudonocardiaceae bacterium]|nr:SCO1664 family protein [Pseudonocardiaceae bacterium]
MLPTDPAALPLLHHGRIEVAGRIVEASNATLLCTVHCDGVSADCVYKPIRGERPLWDFPDGTLAGREVASWLLSEATGWSLVPPTVLRSGPLGPGMVQLWIDTEDESGLVDVVALDAVPQGWRTVLRAHDRYGGPALLVHADTEGMRQLAVLDVLINNADRKGRHVLAGLDGAVYGVDHGICLHREDKLRTVLWGFLGQTLSVAVLDVLRRVRSALDGALGAVLTEHLTRAEVRAVRERTDRLLATETFPAPNGNWPAIPWPAF